MLTFVTLIALTLGVPTDPYIQDGYLPPEGYETPQIDAQTFDAEVTGVGDYSPAVEAWRPLVAGHFGDLGPEAVNTVLCLMGYESAGDPSAQNPTSGASGLMQVMPSWAPKFGVSRADLFRPEINLFIARALYDEAESRGVDGWRHWSPYLRGHCR